MNYQKVGKRDLDRPRKRWLDNRDRNRWHHIILEARKTTLRLDPRPLRMRNSSILKLGRCEYINFLKSMSWILMVLWNIRWWKPMGNSSEDFSATVVISIYFFPVYPWLLLGTYKPIPCRRGVFFDEIFEFVLSWRASWHPWNKEKSEHGQNIPKERKTPSIHTVELSIFH